MATATLTSQLTDELLDPGAPTKFGTGNATKSETVIHLEGTNCAAVGHSGATGTATPVTADSQAANSNFRGCYVAPVPAITRTNKHIHVWIRDLYPVRNKSIGGVSLYLSNGQTAECLYYATGVDAGYAGGWFHYVVDIDSTTHPTVDLGTFPSGDIDRVGYAGNISATKGEAFLQNCYLDAIRSGGDGSGITFTGGLTGDRLTFSDCAAADTSSYGLFRKVGGALFIEGPVTWGVAATATWLQESLKTVNFTNFTTGDGTTSSVAVDYYSVDFVDGTTSVTNIDFTDITWNAPSRSQKFDFTVALGTGDSFASLRSTYIFGGTITYDAFCTSDSDVFVECVTIVPGGITLTSPKFTNCDEVDLLGTGSNISGGSTSRHNTLTTDFFITINDFADIVNHAFDNTGGVGHAVRYRPAGAGPFNQNYSGNTHTGYATQSGTAGNRAILIDPVTASADITLTVTGGGDTPTYTLAAGYTGTFTLVSGSATTTATVKHGVTKAAIQNAVVLMRAAAGGPFPFEAAVTITRSGSVATVAHTGHGMATGNQVEIEGSDQAEYNGIKAITKVDDNSYTFPVSGTPTTPATGTILSTALIINGLTDVAGEIADTRVYSSNQPVTIDIRKSDVAPVFVSQEGLTDTISSSDGLSFTVFLSPDD